MQLIFSLATVLAPVLLAVSEGSDPIAYLGLALFLAGPVCFALIYAHYRNRSERHFHERETPVSIQNLQSYDNFVKHLTRQRSPRIAGANDSQIRGSLVRGDASEKLLKSLGKLLPSDLSQQLKKPK